MLNDREARREACKMNEREEEKRREKEMRKEEKEKGKKINVVAVRSLES